MVTYTIRFSLFQEDGSSVPIEFTDVTCFRLCNTILSFTCLSSDKAFCYFSREYKDLFILINL